ncbi:DedA family protein [Pararhodobacter oceanensis]|uniref:DedA family protein n=1 Tax=Pararhodobacter oceanensis TaxID=2172121 RepID=UPI003A92F3E8
MTDWLFALVSEWGAIALGLVTFLSCLALPVPSSLMMLTAGAFAASGDLELATLALAALGGAVLGDQVGYQLGRVGLGAIEGWLSQSETRAAVLLRARASIHARGGMAVFLSRWLFSPLGPYVNFLAGGSHMAWLVFTLSSIAGEIVWVGVYVGLGYAAGGQLAQVASLLGNVTGLATSLLLTIGLGVALWRRRRAQAAAE